MHRLPDWCPVAATLDVLGGKWTPLILFFVRERPYRFNELRRLLPQITQRMLTLQLRTLEDQGVIRRKVLQTMPPQHVEYSLTAHGRSLVPVLQAIEDWGNQLRPSA